MAEARVCDTKSVKVELQPGTYKWCACGHSQKQPFCDGAHRECGFTPVAFEIAEAKTVSLCLCKQTQKPPFCDGSHKPLREAAMAKAMPARYKGVIPYLSCRDAAKAIEWYKAAFGAVEDTRMADPNGVVGHCEMRIGDNLFMLADEYPDMGFDSPAKFGGTPVRLNLFVFDVDAFCKKAVDAGATLVRAVETQFYGDRTGTLQDPFGHIWNIMTHVEDVSPEEMKRRFEELSKSAP